MDEHCAYTIIHFIYRFQEGGEGGGGSENAEEEDVFYFAKRGLVDEVAARLQEGGGVSLNAQVGGGLGSSIGTHTHDHTYIYMYTNRMKKAAPCYIGGSTGIIKSWSNFCWRRGQIYR